MATKTIAFTKEDQWARIDEVTRAPKHVRLNLKRLEEVAARAPASIASDWISAYRDTDEHYRNAPPVQLNDLDLIQYTFVFGTQGWLIWEWSPDRKAVPLTVTIDGVKYAGASSLAALHARALRRYAAGKAKDFLDADVLANLTLEDAKDHYRDDEGKLSVLLLERRLENFREAGRVLREEFDGHFVNVLRRANRRLFRPDGEGLVQLMQTRFPSSWRDWPMSKLPNVILLPASTMLGLSDVRKRRPLAPDLAPLLEFTDLENIEGGADYYRPWFFIRVGIIDISDEFKRRLRRQELIEPGSDMEMEFRAFTLVAMRKLSELTGGWPQALAALEVETHAVAFLHCRRCRVGISEAELPCAYRDVCKATHEDHELMDGIWPLVLTNNY